MEKDDRPAAGRSAAVAAMATFGARVCRPAETIAIAARAALIVAKVRYTYLYL